MQPELEIITKEIPAKGKAYIIVRRCPPEGLDAALRRGAAQALSQGASLLYAASTDPEAPLEAGEKRGYQLIYEPDADGGTAAAGAVAPGAAGTGKGRDLAGAL